MRLYRRAARRINVISYLNMIFNRTYQSGSILVFFLVVIAWIVYTALAFASTLPYGGTSILLSLWPILTVVFVFIALMAFIGGVGSTFTSNESSENESTTRFVKKGVVICPSCSSQGSKDSERCFWCGAKLGTK